VPADPIVDMEHLARYTGGDAALNAEILRLFDSQVTELVAQLNSILAARDAKAWKQVTHTLKGAARGIGAFSFADVAARLETLDVTGDDSGAARAGIAQLTDRAGAVTHFIRAYNAA